MQKKLLKPLLSGDYAGPKLGGKKYIVSADIQQMGSTFILRATVFTGESGHPYLTVFCSHEAFISWSYREKKWSDAMLDKYSVIGYEWSQKDYQYHRQQMKKYTYDTPVSMQAGAAFIGGADDTLSLIDDFQHHIRDAATMKRHEAQRRKIDDLMAQARPLPKHFQKWVDRIPLAKSRYLYYRRKGQRIQGYCTACGSDIVMSAAGVKHNQPGICPHCHKKITFKAEGISKNVMDEARAEYVQRISGGRLMVREIDITKSYRKDYRHPEYSFYEGSRHIIFPNGHKEKYIPNHNIAWLGEWKKKSDKFEYFAWLYTPNLHLVLKGTSWQYCGIEKYAKQTCAFAVAWYLAESIKYPCLEYLSKMGLSQLLDEEYASSHSHTTVNWDGKNLCDVLKIRQNLIPLAVKMNVSSEKLAMLQLVSETGISVDMENLQWFIEQRLHWHKNELLYLFRHMTPWKIRKYASKVVGQGSERNIGNIIGDWCDYLRNAELLGYNLHKNAILFPRDLEKAHDKVMKLVKVKKDTIVDEKLRGLCKELSSLYGFRNGDYIVRAPSCLKDLLIEGERQENCVAGYAARVARQETVVLFIRRVEAPDEPFVTVEVRGGHVIQMRGFKNSTPEKAVLDFVEAWKKKVLEKAAA